MTTLVTHFKARLRLVQKIRRFGHHGDDQDCVTVMVDSSRAVHNFTKGKQRRLVHVERRVLDGVEHDGRIICTVSSDEAECCAAVNSASEGLGFQSRDAIWE